MKVFGYKIYCRSNLEGKKPCGKAKHDCQVLKGMKLEERIDVVFKHSLCQN